MKVYVKKDNGLKLLGEGISYSKKELMLKEGGITAMVGKNDAPAGNLVNQARQTINTNSNVDSVYIPTEANSSMPGADKRMVANNMQDTTLQTTSDKLNSNELNKASQMGVEGMEVTKPSNSDTQSNSFESIKSRKVMDEMRANSVPFTKSELTAFLKSL